MRDVTLVDRKGQLQIMIVSKKNGKIYLRKAEGLRDWFEQILNNCSAIKFPLQRRKLETSTSLIENPHQHISNTLMIPLHRPLFGISSLTFAFNQQF